jgi:transporter family-2 protein
MTQLTARQALGVGVAVLAGAGAAVQTRINGELAVRLGDGLAAAVVSFGVGLALLVLVVAAVPSVRRGLPALRDGLRAGVLRPWQCLGGVCGALLVASQGLTAATLGVAVFTVAVVAGQSGSGLLVDRFGAGPGGSRPVTGARLAGAALTVAAVLLAVADRFGHAEAVGLALLPALAGAGIAWQQAVNGHVRAVSGSAVVAGLVNFVTGTAVLLLAFAVDVAATGLPNPPGGPWWLYLGGPLGVTFIAIGAAVVRYTGVLLLGLGLVAGQMVGAVAVDVLAPTRAGPPGWTTWAGAALTLVAVAVALRPPRRRAARAAA